MVGLVAIFLVEVMIQRCRGMWEQNRRRQRQTTVKNDPPYPSVKLHRLEQSLIANSERSVSIRNAIANSGMSNRCSILSRVPKANEASKTPQMRPSRTHTVSYSCQQVPEFGLPKLYLSHPYSRNRLSLELLDRSYNACYKF